LSFGPAIAADPIAIQGTLTDRATGVPIANARVLSNATAAPLTSTDANGSYWVTVSQLSGQSRGILYFQTPGYYVSTVSYDVSASPETLNATLVPGGTAIQGTISDANSQAGVAGAQVSFRFACYAGNDDYCSLAAAGASVTSVAGGQYSIDSSQLLETGRAGLQISYERVSAVRFVDQLDSGLTIPVNDPLPVQRDFNLNRSQTIAFEDVTARSGINFTGRSFGASWGDFDGDGWPDAYTGNHGSLGSLWINNRDGTFTNVFPARWTNPSRPDKHGAAFGDFDNDGDQDIMEVSGAGEGTGSSPNLLMVNNAGTATDQAVTDGVDLPLGRGRTPLWLDWNNDGLLDMFISNLSRPDGQAPSALYLQSNGAFKVQSLAALPPKLNSLFAQSSQLMGDGRRMLIIHSSDGYPGPIFQFGTNGTVNLRTALKLPLIANVRDVAIEDFNGDLLPDFYLAILNGQASDAVLTDRRTLKSAFNVGNGEQGVNFVCACDLTFTVGPPWVISPSKVYIGATGAHPASNTFSVSASNSATGGMTSYTPGVSVGLYIGYDAPTQTWTVRATSSARLAVNVMVNSSAYITNLVQVNLTPSSLPVADRLLLNTGKAFVDASNQPALTALTACESVAAGDFDNDMAIDIYLVCRGQVSNLPNILLKNDGTGHFTVVPFAGGAEGSTAGRGDSVSVADFDNDGFLDLLVTNGNGEIPFTNGPYQLFHNLGNGNHWLELQLQGVQSNRDGVGARVIVTAGGKSQMREQNGGVHRISQNSQRLHFGLAGNTAVSTITVYWPSGIVQTLSGIAADQILHITESAQ
jgi:ASPIC and UnbV/FG-GAP-like repeat